MNGGNSVVNPSAGTLYIVSTPIGNLEDITIRAIKTLRACDIIAAEDTRKTLKLLNRYKIKKRLTSYYSANSRYKGKKIIEELKSGKNVALVSEAGMPGISDPGTSLIIDAIKEEIKVSPIGGISAPITALSVSGFDTSRFYFEGFLPRKKGKREKVLMDLASRKETVIIFESPKRVKRLIEEISNIAGNREICICRELTKIHEEVVTDTVQSLLLSGALDNLKGEITLLLKNK